MPDQVLLEKHLADAKLSVQRGEERLAEQRALLEQLSAAGRDTDLATTVLHLLDENLRLLIAHRDRLHAELEKQRRAQPRDTKD